VRRFPFHALLLIASFDFSSAFGQKNLSFNTQQQSGNFGSLTDLRRSAERGDAHAQWMLGNVYKVGSGISQDYREAARWYAAASAQNFAEAQLSLGNLYEQERGVKKNYRQAFLYYQAAARQGLPIAENNLAALYEQGRGTARNPAEARR
jgi:TPR repeat protein